MRNKTFKHEYNDYIESSAPDFDKLWNDIESRLSEKDNPPAAVPVKTRVTKVTKALALTAAGLAVVIAGKVFIIDGAFSLTKSDSFSFSQAQDAQKENANDTAAATKPACDNEIGFSGNTDAAMEQDGALTEPESYEGLMLADSPEANFEISQNTAQAGEAFCEDEILESTDAFIDAVVQSVSRSDDQTGFVYELQVTAFFPEEEKNEEVSITVSEKTTYPLKLNREYLLPVKKTETGFELVFENAPRIEITLDRRLVFHDGWTSLDVGASSVLYPKNNENDAFFDKMRISQGFDISELLEKWKTLKEE